MSDKHAAPTPCNASKAAIVAAAEKFARDVELQPGDPLEPLVERLGGQVCYKRLDDADFDNGSIVVERHGKFTITLPTYTGAARDRFTIAHELGRRGYALALAARSAAPLEQLVAELTQSGASALPVPADLRDLRDVRRLAQITLGHFGRVDALIHNAGIGGGGVLARLPEDAAAATIGTNLLAPIELTRLLLPQMLERRSGSIVFIASSVRHTPPPAVPTQSRHLVPPRMPQRGEISNADTRPDTFFCADEFGLCSVVSGPSEVQTRPLGVRPVYAMPRNAQYFCALA